MSKYYYHGVKRGFVLDKALDIFQKGGIKCMPGARKIGFNGLDYVSICKKEAEEEYGKHSNNAFYNYVQNSICFIISDEIEVIKPEIIENADKWNRFDLVGYMNSKPGVRFSDMFDEWQVYRQVPLSMMIGLGLPLQELDTILTKTSTSGEKRIKELIACALELGMDIVDSSDPNFVEKYENSKEKEEILVSPVKLLAMIGGKNE